MKIILLKSINGKGNKDQIVSLANGYANFLIKEGSAVPANEENRKALEARLQAEKEQDIKDTELANKTKKYLETLKIVFTQIALPDGSTKESITKKDVAEELSKIVNEDNGKVYSYNIEDIRMKPIKQFGLFDIDIKLYKNIKATLKIEILSI